VLVYRIAYLGLVVSRALMPHRARGVKCLLTRGDELLLVRHTYGPRVWHVPGGGMRRGESPLAAASREMREELGLEDLPWRELPSQTLRIRRGTIVLHRFTAEVGARRLRPRAAEIAGAQWFSARRLPASMGAEDRSVLEPPGSP
jgi:ADP-ribose pyrophosphatase YjhB (NUDIX family)